MSNIAALWKFLNFIESFLQDSTKASYIADVD